MKKIAWAVAGAAVGGALGWMALRGAMPADVMKAVTSFDWRILVLAVYAMLFASFLDAVRWKLLLAEQPVSTARLFFVRNAGIGLNNVSPVRIVAEPAQAALLRFGNGIGTHRVVASLAICRLFDLLITVNLVGLGLIVLPQLAGLRPVVLPVWGVTSAAILVLFVLARRLSWLPSGGRFSTIFSLLRSISGITLKGKVMLACLVLSGVSWMLVGVAAWLVGGGAGIDLPFWTMGVVIVAVTLFSGIVPSPPGAVGVYEFGVVSTLGLFSVDPAVAVSFGVVIHAILFAPPTIIGALVLARERRTIGNVFQATRGAIRGRTRAAVAGT